MVLWAQLHCICSVCPPAQREAAPALGQSQNSAAEGSRPGWCFSRSKGQGISLASEMPRLRGPNTPHFSVIYTQQWKPSCSSVWLLIFQERNDPMIAPIWWLEENRPLLAQQEKEFPCPSGCWC